MTARRVLFAIVALGLSACARPPAPVSVPVQRIAIFPANNETGDPLVIAEGTVLEGDAFATERITVPDILVAEARTLLTQQGFALVDPRSVAAATREHVPTNPQEASGMAAKNHLDGAVLFMDIRRWEPDNAFQPRAVIIALDVVLIDATSQRILWRASHPLRPVPTEGSINVGQADVRAARAVIEELLTPLMPARPSQ